jgi:molybdenum cofactor cytidylyltransferase
MRVQAVVLAAGESRRMGRTKATLPYGGATILEAVVRALRACELDRVAVVVGRNRGEIAAAVGSLEVELVENPAPELGMLGSVQRAVERMPEEMEAILIALGDQPQIQPATIRALLGAARGSPRGIFLPTYQGRRGHPALLRARYRQQILALPHTVGLNALIRAHPEDVEEVAQDAPGILEDIDTPEEYARAVRDQGAGSRD